MSSCSFKLTFLLVVVTFYSRDGVAQIPVDCADATSLETSTCCPTIAGSMCGENVGRGACVMLDTAAFGYSSETTNVRVNWPHYYTRVCRCNGNYAGHDCSRCKFGYYGSDCGQKQVLPRRPIRELTEDEWVTYNDLINRTKTYDSKYLVVLEESAPGNSSLVTTNISVYHLYVWLHHYTAKNSEDPPGKAIDYSHSGPAFFTWHRLMNLWLEWEIQRMLQDMGQQDYYTFRLPYWDSRIEIQTSFGVRSEDLFTENRLGVTRDVGGFAQVFGTLYGSESWDTICFHKPRQQICDPRIGTGPLLRCPTAEACLSSNPEWPTIKEINDALEIDEYDVPPYTLSTIGGFRSFLDFKVGPGTSDDLAECRKSRRCKCIPGGGNCTEMNGIPPGRTFIPQLHLTVHTIPGEGYISNTLPKDKKGAMEDTAASPNDPLFVLHHTMCDCVLEEWLKRHSDAEYPASLEVRDGHRRDDYLRGFFPLYTNLEMFTRTEAFGYSCNLANLTDPLGSPATAIVSITWPLMLLMSLFVLIMIK